MTPTPELLETLRTTPGLLLAVAFGSTGRGDETPHDLDLAVAFEEGADPGLGLEGRIARVAGRPLDLVRVDEAPPLLRFEIARDGRVLHEAREGAWVDFKTQAMIDWWDWKPTLLTYQSVSRTRRELEAGRGSA